MANDGAQAKPFFGAIYRAVWLKSSLGGDAPGVEKRMMTWGYVASLRGPVETRKDRCLRYATIHIDLVSALGKNARFVRCERHAVGLHVAPDEPLDRAFTVGRDAHAGL